MSNITTLAKLVRNRKVKRASGELRLGVDLGTANLVLAVVDGTNAPVAGLMAPGNVVRDGVVVDWHGAVQTVAALKAKLEDKLSHRFKGAAVAIPPGIDPGTIKVFTNVLEAAGLAAIEVVDEPVAAARALGITEGTVIDIGHGTTGVSLLKGGEVEYSTDEATGGHHMSLVIAGALRMDYAAAEALKKDPEQADLVAGLIRPTLEKMATIAAKALVGREPGEIHLVGGSSSFESAAGVFADVLSHPVIRADEPLFPTPLGVAMRKASK